MCRFHKELATEIATNPDTKTFDPVAYSLVLTALAKYWINRYMPNMGDCDGYSNYAMATPKAVAALNASGIDLNLERAATYRAANIGALRAALNATINRHGITLSTLGLPADPVADSKFIDAAMVEMYDGDPAVALTLKTKSTNPAQEPLRRAIEQFVAQDDIDPILKTMIEGSFATIFIEARDKVSPTLLAAYQRLPERLTGAFSACAMCVGGGAGGAAVSHLGCILVPMMAGASGSALSATMNTFMLVTSPAIAAGVTMGIDKMRGVPQSIPKIAGSAAFAFFVALGINHFNGHEDHINHDDHHHDHGSEIVENAKALHMSVEAYEASICRTPAAKTVSP